MKTRAFSSRDNQKQSLKQWRKSSVHTSRGFVLQIPWKSSDLCGELDLRS